MKVWIKLEVSDGVRRALGKRVINTPEARLSDITADGRLTKRPLIEYLTRHVQSHLPDVVPVVVKPSLSQTERADLAKVYHYLAALGRSDPEIEEWILLQRARLDLRSLFPHVRKADAEHAKANPPDLR